MLAELTEDTSALDGLLKVFDQLQAPDAMRQIEEMAAGEMGRNFLGSHAPDGAAFAPLASPRPAGRNPGTRPLIDTGELLASVISEGPGHVSEVDGDSVKLGTTNWKAGFHQYGTDRIPARPFIGVNETMADQAAQIVANDLFKQMGV